MEGDHLRFVDRAEEVDQVAEFAVIRRQYRSKKPRASWASQPPRSANHAGSVKWCKVTNERMPVARASRGRAIVRDGGSAELAGSGLDACPLERQPVSRVSHAREKLEVLGEAMEMVDRVAGRLRAALPGPCS